MNFCDDRPTFEIQNLKKRSPHCFATFWELNPRPTELLNQYPPVVTSPFTVFEISSESQKTEAPISTLNSGVSYDRGCSKTHGTVFELAKNKSDGVINTTGKIDNEPDT
jgi:hypothetical protein